MQEIVEYFEDGKLHRKCWVCNGDFIPINGYKRRCPRCEEIPLRSIHRDITGWNIELEHVCVVCGKMCKRPYHYRHYFCGSDCRDRYYARTGIDPDAHFKEHQACYMKEARAMLENKHWEGRNKCVKLEGD